MTINTHTFKRITGENKTGEKMNRSVQAKEPPQKKGEEGKITMDDIRAHLARYGRDIPCVLPLTSGIEEAPAKIEEPQSRVAETPKAKENGATPGLGPLDTSGLRYALIHNPRDVNSPY
jgi:hypothetical protein